MGIANFKNDICRGKEGEKYFFKIFNQLGNNVKIYDVSNDEAYQNCDIDFILIKNGKKYCIEIKTDSYTSGNMFYEELSCQETHSIGCFSKTCANLLLYYFPKMNLVYVFYDMNNFKDWYSKNREKYRHCKIPNYRRNGGIYNAWGGLIPLKDIDEYNESAENCKKFAKRMPLNKEITKTLIEIVDLSEPYEINECVKVSRRVRIKPEFVDIR